MRTVRNQSKGRGLRVLSSKKRYQGPVFSIYTDKVREPTGVVARRDVVRHPGSVVIMAVDDSRDSKILLVRQFRYVAGRFLWELPAGMIDPGEKKLPAAKRELLEETGYSAREWKHAFRYFASPGFVDETMNVYLARGLQRGQAHPEEDERITTRLFPLSEALRMCLEGKILDGKTLSGVFWLAQKMACVLD